MSYQCDNCFKEFTLKGDYNRHVNRKNMCKFASKINTKAKIYKCVICKKEFNRKCYLDKHVCKLVKPIKQRLGDVHNEKSMESQIVSVNGNNNGTISNNIIIGYSLFPFAKDGIDCLSTSEKVAIFTSDKNPCEMIIIKVNLDPLKINHHNVGISDLHQGYGMIFNGNEWITERISVILEVLLNSKEKDLLKIHNEIKDFVSEDVNKTIKNKINDLNNTLNPRSPVEIKAKNILTTHLKKYFYNNRELAINAKKYTQRRENIQENFDNDYEGILKKGMTIDEMDIKLKKRKHKIDIAKEICYDFLNKSSDKKTISQYNYKLIATRTKTTDEIINLNCIMNMLFGSAYLNNILTDSDIEEQVAKINEMKSYFNF